MNSRETYTKFARYYDLYAGSFSADLPLYRSFCGPGSRILEIGCGTGRVLRPVLETGARVTGVDISEEMLAFAGEKLADYLECGQLVLINHDFRALSLAESFDHVFVSFYTFNYLLTEDEQARFLCNVRKCLAPHGTLLLDLFYPHPLARPESADQWTESFTTGGGGTLVLRQKRRMSGAVEERVQIYEKGDIRDEIVTNRRYVTKQEADALLTSAGFAEVRVANGYGLDDLHPVGATESTGSSFICAATGMVK
jgi:SAM-dependent methyltransferase